MAARQTFSYSLLTNCQLKTFQTVDLPTIYNFTIDISSLDMARILCVWPILGFKSRIKAHLQRSCSACCLNVVYCCLRPSRDGIKSLICSDRNGPYSPKHNGRYLMNGWRLRPDQWANRSWRLWTLSSILPERYSQILVMFANIQCLKSCLKSPDSTVQSFQIGF